MNKALNTIGLSYRASKLLIGSDYTISGIKENKVYLIILDRNLESDISKKIKRISEEKGIPLVVEFDSDEMSKSIGKKGVHVLGITDKGFRDSILRQLNKEA